MLQTSPQILTLGTALGGPVGGAIGSFLGGAIGGAIGDTIYNSLNPPQFPPSPYNPLPKDEKSKYIKYESKVQVSVFISIHHPTGYEIYTFVSFGIPTVRQVPLERTPDADGFPAEWEFISYGQSTRAFPEGEKPNDQPGSDKIFEGFYGYKINLNPQILSITRLYDPNTSPSPSPSPNPSPSPSPSPNPSPSASQKLHQMMRTCPIMPLKNCC